MTLCRVKLDYFGYGYSQVWRWDILSIDIISENSRIGVYLINTE